MNKLLIICGPTATGKTDLALSLAKKFHGELVSADSRQIYIGMDIGTGKDIPKSSKFKVQSSNLHIKDQTFLYGFYTIEGIPLRFVDIARPDQEFSVAHYTEIAQLTIDDIHKRGKLPIMVGGTGLYLKAMTQNIATLHIPQNKILRQSLAAKSVEELQQLLAKNDRKKWESMNVSDKNNPRRLIRAIEVTKYSQKSPLPVNKYKQWESLWIGLMAENKVLFSRINTRVDERVQKGIIKEIKTLLARGYDFNLPSFQTLGYQGWQSYFAGKATKEETIALWKLHEYQYAQRQMTWFKKQKKINWFDITDKNARQSIEEFVRSWYTT